MDEKDKKIKELEDALEKEKADKAKILGEKKELLKLFNEDEKEGMTDTEKKLAETLEQERAERVKLQEALDKDAKDRTEADAKRVADEAQRVQTALYERITRVAKGDKTIEDKLKANVGLLDKLPRGTEAELDAIVNTGYNMLGQKDSNPLNSMNGINGGAPAVDEKASYSSTQEGKNLAGKIGLQAVAKEGQEGEGDK